MTVLWIIVAIFVVIAIVAGGVQALAALGDKRNSERIAADKERLHTDPLDPENPSSPDGGRS